MLHYLTLFMIYTLSCFLFVDYEFGLPPIIVWSCLNVFVMVTTALVNRRSRLRLASQRRVFHALAHDQDGTISFAREHVHDKAPSQDVVYFTRY